MTLEQLDAEIVVVSDIHLTSVADERGQLLLKLLKNLSENVQYFILNGDIFDFCFGKDPYFKEKFLKLGICFEHLGCKGTKIIFVEGNHEFAMQDLGWQSVQVVDETQYVLSASDGRIIAVTHGDLLSDDPWYRRFRRVIKSKKTHSLAAMIPGRWLDLYALNHARISRAQDRYRHLDHYKIIEAAFSWLGESKAHSGIFGHFHVPYCEYREVKNENRNVVCLESWDKPNILVYREGSFFRSYLHDWEKTGRWNFIKPVSFFDVNT